MPFLIKSQIMVLYCFGQITSYDLIIHSFFKVMNKISIIKMTNLKSGKTLSRLFRLSSKVLNMKSVSKMHIIAKRFIPFSRGRNETSFLHLT